MSHNFTVSAGLASLVDERPVVQVVVDISEPLAVLTAGLCEICPDQLVDDSTVQYIGSLLVDSVASPHPKSRAISQVSSFFHPEYREKVNELATQVKEIISTELHCAEKASELQLAESIYPAKDINTIMSRRGNLFSLSYRLGREVENPGSDDPYLGYDPVVRQVEEEADDDASEGIIHLD